METITNYKIKDFQKLPKELQVEYASLLLLTTPIQTNQKLIEMKLKEVEEIKTFFTNNSDEELIKIMAMVQKVKIGDINNMGIITFFGIYNSIKLQFENLIKSEENLAPNYVNPKWEQVEGGIRMVKFGIYNTLEDLSGGDILKWPQIMEMEYQEVFTKLMINKVKGDLIYEMDRIKSKN
ncbi:MAG: hypothetical protein Q8O62_04420 [Aequorivita sp.]|nr:hypothetical protein [Aequorivita sp.]